MRIPTKPWIVFPAIAVAVGCFAFFLNRQFHPGAVSNAELVHLVPPGGDARFFANFAMLRHAGILKLLSPAAQQDADYRQFVRNTKFDYSRDIDAIAGVSIGPDFIFSIRGRFDWPSLRRYALSHGGHCQDQLCRVPASESGRWASFRELRSDVMLLSLAPLRSPHLESFLEDSKPLPQAPVWLELSPRLLRSMDHMPVGLRLFASALEPANSLLFLLNAAPASSGNAFQIEMRAGCPSPAAATTIANQLQLDTKLLKMVLTRKGQNAGSSSLAGVVLGGQFHSEESEAVGVWPVSRTLVQSLE